MDKQNERREMVVVFLLCCFLWVCSFFSYFICRLLIIGQHRLFATTHCADIAMAARASASALLHSCSHQSCIQCHNIAVAFTQQIKLWPTK